eukprot:TRINITY_DN18282_c0_g1_i1.p1 TRINITY_DN18282_c0_g1~~TRINITY_DN18282_c0_g1_i1.p1  ORF type:complete len:247 (-),score=56.47 TRINITY_DN18282_c0_g1_i1:169-909(-)
MQEDSMAAVSQSVSRSTYVYLHGFASGAGSTKGRSLVNYFSSFQTTLHIPDWNRPSFSQLSLSAGLTYLTQELSHLSTTPSSSSLRLIGSSMGGYLATTLSQNQALPIESLLLLCPGFDIANRWQHRYRDWVDSWQQRGYIELFNYNTSKREPLHAAFFDEICGLEPYPLPPPHVPITIIHGVQDDVVAIESSRLFVQLVQRHREGVEQAAPIRLIEVEDDHQLCKEATLQIIKSEISNAWLGAER